VNFVIYSTHGLQRSLPISAESSSSYVPTNIDNGFGRKVLLCYYANHYDSIIPETEFQTEQCCQEIVFNLVENAFSRINQANNQSESNEEHFVIRHFPYKNIGWECWLEDLKKIETHDKEIALRDQQECRQIFNIFPDKNDESTLQVNNGRRQSPKSFSNRKKEDYSGVYGHKETAFSQSKKSLLNNSKVPISAKFTLEHQPSNQLSGLPMSTEMNSAKIDEEKRISLDLEDFPTLYNNKKSTKTASSSPHTLNHTNLPSSDSSSSTVLLSATDILPMNVSNSLSSNIWKQSTNWISVFSEKSAVQEIQSFSNEDSKSKQRNSNEVLVCSSLQENSLSKSEIGNLPIPKSILSVSKRDLFVKHLSRIVSFDKLKLDLESLLQEDIVFGNFDVDSSEVSCEEFSNDTSELAPLDIHPKQQPPEKLQTQCQESSRTSIGSTLGNLSSFENCQKENFYEDPISRKTRQNNEIPFSSVPYYMSGYPCQFLYVGETLAQPTYFGAMEPHHSMANSFSTGIHYISVPSSSFGDRFQSPVILNMVENRVPYPFANLTTS